MGIVDSIKKVATDGLKTAANATTKAVSASSSKAIESVVAKTTALVGSKVTDAILKDLGPSPPNTAASPQNPAAAKAAALVGSKAAPNQQLPAESSKLSPAEVEAIIEARVRAKGGSSNWRYSIVDLMSALDMNSSLDSRKALAARLNYYGYDADGSAEKNSWLHAELLRLLAQNGGELPSELKAAASVVSAPNVPSYATPKELSPEVEAIIEARARAKSGSSNWRHSIVDLMTVFGMNSSLASRKELSVKLNYSGYDADGSAEKNSWLHSELLKALAENGGEVPYYLL
jgi:hypothetical protein